MIVDAHIHIWAPEYIPKSMRYNWARLAAHRRYPFRDPDEIFPKVTRGVADPEGTHTMAEMDRAGVDASVSMLVDYSVLCDEEAEVPLVDVMEHYQELQERYEGRFYAFSTVDPRRPNAVEIFERAIKDFGLRGLKLYPAAGFYPYDEACIPLYRRCVEWDIPVTFHTSTVESPFIQRYTHPMQLSDVQAMFPDLKIILAHAGKGPWWQEATAVAAAHPHTYLELSMWSEVAFRDPGECVAKLAHMRDTVGAHKILFASDNCAGPATEGERSWLHRWVDFFRELPELAPKHGHSFTREEVGLILGENATRVMRLDGVRAATNGAPTSEKADPMLSNVRVLDLTGTLPGPYCTLLLAHFGAEVIKVERPGAGDSMREMDPWLYENLNRGKKSVALDMKPEEGRETLRMLAGDADVVVEGFRPGVVERLGADYESLRAINPTVVYCSISGFGQDSPYRDRPGHDIDYMAISGALAMTGKVEEDPPEGHVQKIPVSDLAAGLFAANSILAALASEERESVYVDVSMTDLVLTWAALKSGHYFGGTEPRKPTVEAHYGVFRTKDGESVALGVIEDHFWQRLCRYFGWDDFLQDPELGAYEDRNRHAERILPRLRAAVAKKERGELVEDLLAMNVPCSPVQNWAEVAEDPHVRHRDLLGRGTDAEGRDYASIGIPYRYRGFEPRGLERAPRLGEHNAEVLEPLRNGRRSGG